MLAPALTLGVLFGAVSEAPALTLGVLFGVSVAVIGEVLGVGNPSFTLGALAAALSVDAVWTGDVLGVGNPSLTRGALLRAVRERMSFRRRRARSHWRE